MRRAGSRDDRAGGEPPPAHVVPMLALLAELPADGASFGFEYKWDGVRAVCYFDGHHFRLESRNLIDVTPAYPELAGLAGALGEHRAVLDGEIVALNAAGVPDFGMLQRRLGVKRPDAVAGSVPVYYMIFDLLYLDGRSLMDLPYRERRERLERMGLEAEHWHTPPYYTGEGETLLKVARQRHLEGVVAKRLDSPYQPGRRSGAWLKVKVVASQEFIIGGWLPLLRTASNPVGSLLLGYYDLSPEEALRQGRPQSLRYAGRVGTGFSERERVRLRELLEEHGQAIAPFAAGGPRPRGANWVQPLLVAEVEFRGWTPGEHLRQPSYKGLRADREPRWVLREDRPGMMSEAV
ncbi:MAG: non-homologous end-joining DNA ligase [Candidatus Geothermincolia bacterium]